MSVSADDLRPATGLEEILSINIEEERAAIRAYATILERVTMDNVILFQTLQEIIRDEQEHLEELQALTTSRA
jgi:rubrerythrin